ncbi:hypothetical protein ACIPYQ_22755 [Streptomyces sp. NPDC090045]|uniref:hypothetical protein n=1 Tax=Streptomyces sp. NPDC090045 TaxID=3365927 RepID=UPI003822DC8D
MSDQEFPPPSADSPDPSDDLADRAAVGFERFLERLEAPAEDVQHDRLADAPDVP